MEFNQSEGSFPIEYEVEEDTAVDSPAGYDTDGSESPVEVT